MNAPHHINNFNRDQFMDWIEAHGGSISEPTNQFEVIRYRKWEDTDTKRPTTHIVYARKNGSLTYGGSSRAHYERSMKGAAA